MRTLVKYLDVAMIAVFLGCVGLQYNDPDARVWMPVYGAAALACILYVGGLLPLWMSAAIGFVALGWAVTIAPNVVGRVRFGDMFQFMQAQGGVEEAREMAGLLLIAAWMFVLNLAVAARRRAVRRAARV